MGSDHLCSLCHLSSLCNRLEMWSKIQIWLQPRLSHQIEHSLALTVALICLLLCWRQFLHGAFLIKHIKLCEHVGHPPPPQTHTNTSVLSSKIKQARLVTQVPAPVPLNGSTHNRNHLYQVQSELQEYYRETSHLRNKAVKVLGWENTNNFLHTLSSPNLTIGNGVWANAVFPEVIPATARIHCSNTENTFFCMLMKIKNLFLDILNWFFFFFSFVLSHSDII